MNLDELKAKIKAHKERAIEPGERLSGVLVPFVQNCNDKPLKCGAIVFCIAFVASPSEGDVVVLFPAGSAKTHSHMIGIYHRGDKGQSVELRRLAAPDAPGRIFNGKQYTAIRPVVDIAGGCGMIEPEESAPWWSIPAKQPRQVTTQEQSNNKNKRMKRSQKNKKVTNITK